MNTMHWFQVTIDEQEADRIRASVPALGFEVVDDAFQDAQGRMIKFVSVDGKQRVEIGIPTTDLIDEQEQLEHVVALLGLDEDTIQSL